MMSTDGASSSLVSIGVWFSFFLSFALLVVATLVPLLVVSLQPGFFLPVSLKSDWIVETLVALILSEDEEDNVPFPSIL